MSYQKVGADFFSSVSAALPAEWMIETKSDDLSVQQWFEPESGSLVAQCVAGNEIESSCMVHESYACVDRALS
jgi:hypothetical protein